MRLVAALFLFLLTSSCYLPEGDCAAFKNGTFEIEALAGTEILTTKIIRKDSLEIDYFRGKTDSSSVRWLNDCEYVVKKLNPKNQAEKKAIHMKILSTDKNSYTFEFKEVGETKTRKATAKKLN